MALRNGGAVMDLNRVNLRTLHILGFVETPRTMPADLKRMVDGLKAGRSYDPFHVAVVIESLHAAYVEALGRSENNDV